MPDLLNLLGGEDPADIMWAAGTHVLVYVCECGSHAVRIVLLDDNDRPFVFAEYTVEEAKKLATALLLAIDRIPVDAVQCHGETGQETHPLPTANGKLN